MISFGIEAFVWQILKENKKSLTPWWFCIKPLIKSFSERKEMIMLNETHGYSLFILWEKKSLALCSKLCVLPVTLFGDSPNGGKLFWGKQEQESNFSGRDKEVLYTCLELILEVCLLSVTYIPTLN